MAKRKAVNNALKTRAGVDEAPALRVHIVRKGDTLRSLARFYLGDPNRLNEIVQLNSLESSVIKVDDELIIPNR